MYAVDAFEQTVEILDLRGGRAVVFRKYCDGIRVLVVDYTDIVICAVIPAVFYCAAFRSPATRAMSFG